MPMTTRKMALISLLAQCSLLSHCLTNHDAQNVPNGLFLCTDDFCTNLHLKRKRVVHVRGFQGQCSDPPTKWVFRSTHQVGVQIHPPSGCSDPPTKWVFRSTHQVGVQIHPPSKCSNDAMQRKLFVISETRHFTNTIALHSSHGDATRG